MVLELGVFLPVAKHGWILSPSVTMQGRWMELTDCISRSKPLRKPHPPVVCAGTSPRGMRFAIEHGTHAFIGASDLDELGAINTRYRSAAAEQGRTIKTYTTPVSTCSSAA